MAIDVTCQCGKLLSVGDEFDGRRQQCPNCRTWLTLPRRPDPQQDAAVALFRKTKVPLGITCVFYGFLLSMFVNLVVDLGLLRHFQTFRFVGWCLGTAWWLAGIPTGIGCLLCLSAPSEQSGKRYAVAAAVFNLTALAWSICVFGLRLTVLPIWMRTGFDLVELTGSMWLLGRVQIFVWWFSLLPLIGAICFILFLKHLGHFLGERDIAAKAAGMLKFSAWAVVLWFGLIGFLWFGGVRVLPNFVWRTAHWLSGYLLVLAGIVGIVRYGLLLKSCRSALSNR